jgi:CDP-6-deoxy-D-xylo-4-hexulose-3-dehydrase
MVNSGSSANLLLLQSLKNIGLLKNSDCIGFSALTWSTNVMPIIQLGMIPIPIDVTLETLNVSEKNLKNALKKNKIKCLFLTNVLGFADDISKILKICKKNKIVLIEDNCESLGSEINKKKLGSFGLASTHSFYVGHHISSIEGGSVSTSSSKLNDMLKITRAHGWARNLNSQSEKKLIKKHNIKDFFRKYTFYDLGFNFRPKEINAFLGFNQLNYLKKIIKIRFINFLSFNNIYKKNLVLKY